MARPLVVGLSPAEVDGALDRHAHGGGVTASQYAQAFNGLPQNSLVEAFGNLAGVLSGPSAAKARQVPWVAALRSYATSISANSSGLTFQYRLDTTGQQLTQAQVPLAPATVPPTLAGTLPIAAGIEDPAHIVAFVEIGGAGEQPGLLRQVPAAPGDDPCQDGRRPEQRPETGDGIADDLQQHTRDDGTGQGSRIPPPRRARCRS